MYLVQSVLFDKSKFSLHLSKEWLKHHHYKHLDVDEKPNTWRFRQVSPNEAKKQGYTNFKTKKLGKSGVSLVLAYNQEKSGGGLHNDELYHFLFNSYSNGKDYKYWVLDHSLSDNQVQVYFNNLNHLAVVVHRGSQDLQDWYENAKTAVGLNEGKRLEHSRIIQKKAELKYGAKNVITIGHSKGALHAEKVGQNSGEIITLNKPVTVWDVVSRKKVPEHQTDIKTGLDPVSFLRRFQPGNKYEHIESGSYNPFKEHSTDVLVENKEGFNENLTEKYWGKGRCWKGYEPVPERKPYSKGSCRKTGGAIRNETQYRTAVAKMKHLLKEKDLLDEEKDDLEEQFNDVIEYAEEKFYDLDYIDANKFKVVLDLMIKKKIFTKRARELLNEYFAEEEEEHYSDDDFEPYTGKGRRRRKTGKGRCRKVKMIGGSFWSRLFDCIRPRNRVHIDERTSREIFQDCRDAVANFQRQHNSYFSTRDVNNIRRMLNFGRTYFQNTTDEEKALLISFIRDVIINNDGFPPNFRNDWREWLEMMREAGRVPEDIIDIGNENLTPRDINVNISGRGREMCLSCD